MSWVHFKVNVTYNYTIKSFNMIKWYYIISTPQKIIFTKYCSSIYFFRHVSVCFGMFLKNKILKSYKIAHLNIKVIYEDTPHVHLFRGAAAVNDPDKIHCYRKKNIAAAAYDKHYSLTWTPRRFVYEKRVHMLK